jgi:transposase
VLLLLSKGQRSDYKGAALLVDAIPRAKELPTDRGYDADWFRNPLLKKGIAPCIPSKKNRKVPIEYNKTFCPQRHKVENMFAKLKDWRRIRSRFNRWAHTFVAAICISATVAFWINQ